MIRKRKTMSNDGGSTLDNLSQKQGTTRRGEISVSERHGGGVPRPTEKVPGGYKKLYPIPQKVKGAWAKEPEARRQGGNDQKGQGFIHKFKNKPPREGQKKKVTKGRAPMDVQTQFSGEVLRKGKGGWGGVGTWERFSWGDAQKHKKREIKETGKSQTLNSIILKKGTRTQRPGSGRGEWEKKK